MKQQELRDARLSAEMTQQEAALKAGITASSWSRYERGKAMPPPATARRLCAAVNLTVMAVSWIKPMQLDLEDYPEMRRQ